MQFFKIVLFMMASVAAIACELELSNFAMTSRAADIMNFIERPLGMRIFLSHPRCLYMALIAPFAETPVKFISRQLRLMTNITAHTIRHLYMANIFNYLSGRPAAGAGLGIYIGTSGDYHKESK